MLGTFLIHVVTYLNLTAQTEVGTIFNLHFIDEDI